MYKKLLILVMVFLLVGCKDDANNQISLLEDEIEQKNALLQEKEETIDLLNESLADLENQINVLKADLEATVEDQENSEASENINDENSFEDISDQVLEPIYLEVKNFLTEAQNMYPDYKYVDFRLEDVLFVKEFKDINDINVFAYRINYKLKSLAPENIIFAGGMYKDENDWIMTTYPDATYFFFDSDNNYLFNMMINDASPDSEIFRSDLLNKLKSLE